MIPSDAPKIREAKIRAAYPNVWEHPDGSIWISKEAADADDLDDCLGWSWDDAVENQAECERIARKRARIQAWPRTYKSWRWIWTRYGFLRMFLILVWRKTGYLPADEDHRISWITAWDVAKGLWLR